MPEETVIINFKHYMNASGIHSVELAGSLLKGNIPDQVNVLFSVGLSDIAHFTVAQKKHVFAQHVDFVDYGPYTGKISIDHLMENDVRGSLLNHSECRVPKEYIEKTVAKANSMGFSIVLCVENEQEAERYSGLKPRFIAYEPPELIGGDISVSTSKPEIIERVVSIADRHDVDVLVGAGVKKKEDYRKSIELGAKGVLVASGIVKSEDPVSSLNSLINS